MSDVKPAAAPAVAASGTPSLGRRLLAETVGTALLVTVVVVWPTGAVYTLGAPRAAAPACNCPSSGGTGTFDAAASEAGAAVDGARCTLAFGR